MGCGTTEPLSEQGGKLSVSEAGFTGGEAEGKLFSSVTFESWEEAEAAAAAGTTSFLHLPAEVFHGWSLAAVPSLGQQHTA